MISTLKIIDEEWKKFTKISVFNTFYFLKQRIN